jgi:hypothetical protein
MKPTKSQIVEIPVWYQEREFLTDRSVGSLSRPEKFSPLYQYINAL